MTLAWDANSGAAGYKVYYGTQSRNYSNSYDVGSSTTHTVTGLQAGTTYYFAVSAYNASRVESGYSNEVTRTIAASCVYAISPASRSFSSSGGSTTVSVTTSQGCAWNSSSGAPWATITSGQSGSGNGTVGLSVSANTGGSRAAGITIAGQTFTVYQDAASSTYTISASAGRNGSISPSRAVSVKAGASLTFSISPRSGYRISSVLVDGVSVGRVSTYTFTNVKANHKIRATFTRRR